MSIVIFVLKLMLYAVVHFFHSRSSMLNTVVIIHMHIHVHVHVYVYLFLFCMLELHVVV